ncbi:MAG: hypothetical protein HZA52_17540 [Planctomycetes bacterium]|nr:hypothetical protein [Planctomycetota bacterium]
MNAGPQPVAGRNRKRLAWLGLVVVALALVEVGTRVRLAVDGRAWDSDGGRASAVQALAESRRRAPAGMATSAGAADPARSVLHPYFARDTLAHREALRRAVELDTGADAASGFDVVVLGGTEAARFAASDAQALLERLRVDPRLAGRTPRLWNEARGQFKQPQQVSVLAYVLASGVEPELVISLDGPGDIALCLDNGRAGSHPVYPARELWALRVGRPVDDPERLAALLAWRRAELQVERTARRQAGFFAVHSAFVGSLGASKLAREIELSRAALANVDAVGARSSGDFVVTGPKHPAADDAILRTAARAWFEGAFTNAGICRERDTAYVHVLLATPDAGAGGDTPVGRGFGLLHSALGRLATRGVAVVDGEQARRDGRARAEVLAERCFTELDAVAARAAKR